MNKDKLLKAALILAVITVLYNVIEGLVSVYFGASDETISLFGFGLDSFIEVLSGSGVLHMVIRIKRSSDENPDRFERTALLITGVSFIILTIGLIITVVYNVISDHKPQTTFWGIVISLISIASMIFLMRYKLSVGRKLQSDAIIADANCTKTCVYLSVVLLISSVLFEIFSIGYIDSIGAIGIAVFSFREGMESIGKSKGKSCSCCGKEDVCSIK